MYSMHITFTVMCVCVWCVCVWLGGGGGGGWGGGWGLLRRVGKFGGGRSFSLRSVGYMRLGERCGGKEGYSRWVRQH